MSSLLPAMLFVPGGDDRKVEKVRQLTAPALILDLEDAVADSAKAHARDNVAATLERAESTVPLWVRVNQHPELLYDDLLAVVRSGLAGVVLPKVSGARDIHVADHMLSQLERRARLEPPIRLMPTIENVEGLSAVEQIAAASPRIQCLVFGAGDFSLDVGLEWPPPSGRLGLLLMSAKCRLVLASRRGGLQPPHDGAYPRFRDLDGLRQEALDARDVGMFGKHAIHPGQVQTILDTFVPSEEQIERARRLVHGFDTREAQGVGNVDLDGMFTDYPVAARARQLLELAAALEQGSEAQ